MSTEAPSFSARVMMTAALVLMALPVFAHSGGLDANRCHTDWETKTKHCHKPAAEKILHGVVYRVSDGDTIRVLADGQRLKVRLQGIDCPETAQPYGKTAKAIVSDWLMDEPVILKTAGKDRYGRTIGKVFMDDRNVAHMLVASGACWRYVRYAKDTALIGMEAQARQARRGLWAQDNPIAPWEWRRHH